MKQFDIQLGAKLRERRELAGMSMRELGEACGVTGQQVQKYETAKDRVSCSRLNELAEELGTSAGYFYDDKPYAELAPFVKAIEDAEMIPLYGDVSRSHMRNKAVDALVNAIKEN